MNKRAMPHGIGVRDHSAALADDTACAANEARADAGRPNKRQRGRRMLMHALSLLLLAAGGCQLRETREAGDLPPVAPEPVPKAQKPAPAPVADLSTAIDYLESGKGEAAAAVLRRLAEKTPGSTVLAGLLRQIEQPPQKVLSGPYRQVEVAAGESLSSIAARELGDPLMFYALARLNGIDVPAQIPVGTVLKVPETVEAESDADPAPAGAAGIPSEISVAEIESVARYLARSGQGDQARAMLIEELGDGDGAETTEKLLVGLALARAAELRAGTEYKPAIGVIDEALAVTNSPDQQSSLTETREAIRSEMLRESALRLRERGELAEAYKIATMAASLRPVPDDDAASLAEELRDELVDSLHNEALLAWRDRNVDLAIRTWESLLGVLPDFEPARVYLERARLLRKRLDEP